ncbi:hypothetical protein BDK51DRAFT_10869, partial [Blyttiomyces helicus]
SMLSACDLPESFWGDAVLYAVHVLNLCPTTALSPARTSYEALYGVPPYVNHLRLFGCLRYAYI